MTHRLFDLDEIPEVPLFREPPPGRGAQIMDERLSHDYPPEWHRCPGCNGKGRLTLATERGLAADQACPDCLGMGSVKAMVRLLAGHRCERCGHPYVPKGDAKMLGVAPTPHHWSPCDEHCTHAGPIRVWLPEVDAWAIPHPAVGPQTYPNHEIVEAEWRILTVHHLDGDKSNLQPWNLAALCQRDHLAIQSKVVMERVYPHTHSPWFRWHAAGYYAWVYLGERLTRPEIEARMDELLALELTPA